jgi:hypothetical protein
MCVVTTELETLIERLVCLNREAPEYVASTGLCSLDQSRLFFS